MLTVHTMNLYTHTPIATFTIYSPLFTFSCCCLYSCMICTFFETEYIRMSCLFLLSLFTFFIVICSLSLCVYLFSFLLLLIHPRKASFHMLPNSFSDENKKKSKICEIPLSNFFFCLLFFSLINYALGVGTLLYIHCASFSLFHFLNNFLKDINCS